MLLSSVLFYAAYSKSAYKRDVEFQFEKSLQGTSDDFSIESGFKDEDSTTIGKYCNDPILIT